MASDIETLPIYPYLDSIVDALKSSPSHFLVLTAETAAGKSTAVPLALLQSFKGNILMLEPRRIAALAVTRRVAELLGENVGDRVGCVVRMERHTSERTRFTVMTEGVLIRMLQDDPMLEGVDAVVIDEAHERGINTDLALAMLKETVAARGDLCVIVMSATMDATEMASYLGTKQHPAPVLNVPGKRYPVETVYRADTSATDAVLQESERLGRGDAMLVFLPGIKEIKQAERDIAKFVNNADIMVLHSSVPLEEQRRVLSPPKRSAWNAARDTLALMGLLERIGDEYRITPMGKASLQLGLHPRLACVALAGLSPNASESSGNGSEGEASALRSAVSCAIDYSDYADSAPRLRHRAEEDLMRRIKAVDRRMIREAASPFLLAGFPDRLARLDEDGVHYRFPSGRVASMRGEAVHGCLNEWIVAPEVDAGETEGTVRKWEALQCGAAEVWLDKHAQTVTETQFANGSYKLSVSQVTCYGKIILSRRTVPVTCDVYIDAVCKAVEENGIEWLPLGEAAREFLLRARFYAQHSGEALPDRDTLRGTPRQWLSPFITGTLLTESMALDALRYGMDGEAVDRHVPRRIVLPNGTGCKVVYEAIGRSVRPSVEVIIQKAFGCTITPRIMGVPVTFKLLSPARRPLQVTSDIEGFWHSTWRDVAKEMRGRYPKHDWSYVPKQ